MAANIRNRSIDPKRKLRIYTIEERAK